MDFSGLRANPAPIRSSATSQLSTRDIASRFPPDRATTEISILHLHLCHSPPLNAVLEASRLTRLPSQAYRLITQVVFVGTRIVGRSFAAAYKQAQASSEYARAQAKNGNAAAGTKGNLSSGMTLDEACKILDVETPKDGSKSAGNVMERFKKLFDANDPKKGGSFYLQSKVLRARERLEKEIGPLAEKEEVESEVKEGFKPKIYKDR
ncbi:mitochondrial import inner membrane translocase subunit TIM16 [Colletotrichum tofieldiae]|nr:mitochondrial import inner membrane translocase subunit Tim16 [Colletotrichum tofieldiae]GKT71081.1 mitochondrial import inner membrane translocase subunit TIM16 [Colletotrichum tofieldiae]